MINRNSSLLSSSLVELDSDSTSKQCISYILKPIFTTRRTRNFQHAFISADFYCFTSFLRVKIFVLLSQKRLSSLAFWIIGWIIKESRWSRKGFQGQRRGALTQNYELQGLILRIAECPQGGADIAFNSHWRKWLSRPLHYRGTGALKGLVCRGVWFSEVLSMHSSHRIHLEIWVLGTSGVRLTANSYPTQLSKSNVDQ